jgi:hypothetical protein
VDATESMFEVQKNAAIRKMKPVKAPM